MAALVLAVLAGTAVWSAALAGEARASAPLRHVRIQLKWMHAFQFAGYYAAIEQGYFRDAGLEAELIPGHPDVNPPDVVIAGGADFGVGNSGLLLDRARGLPVVAIGAIFQHSPLIILARRDPSLQSVHDLAGRRIMMEEHAAELLAYLEAERIPLKRVVVVPHTGDARALRDQVDALTAYSTVEPYDLAREQIPFQVFNPRSAGIDFYGDTLFTSAALAAREPELVREVKAAVVRGWRYALDHPDETIDLIIRRYAPATERTRLEFEAAATRQLMAADVVDIGYMSPGRWRAIAEGFASVGLAPRDLKLDGFLFDETPPPPDLRALYAVLGTAILLAVIGAVIAHRFARLNRLLRAEIASRRRLEGELVQLAATDPLTGLLNRRRYEERALEEVHRARRQKQALATLMLDIDRFKLVNDAHGHQTGDRALQAVAEICNRTLREVDVISRYGGEEFSALLPATDTAGAAEAAERLRHAVAGLAVKAGDGRRIPLTVSIGVAVLDDADEDFSALLWRADIALYRAKHDGRNQTVVWSGTAAGNG